MEPHLSASIRHALSLKNCQAIERGYNLDELADFYSTMTVFIKKDEIPTEKQIEDAEYISEIAFKAGFKKALELMGDKKFNLGQLITAMDMARVMINGGYAHSGEEIFQSLQQNEWEVEIIMECTQCQSYGYVSECRDNCNKKFLQPKLDADGRLILKRVV